MTQGVTFLQKSYGEYTKVKKPALVTMSYEGQDNEEELKMVPVINNNNNLNVVSDPNNYDDIKNDNNNFFDKDIDDEVKATLQTAINTKVVCAIKKLQALYNNDANKIIKNATKKACHQEFKLPDGSSMVTNDTKPVLNQKP